MNDAPQFNMNRHRLHTQPCPKHFLQGGVEYDGPWSCPCCAQSLNTKAALTAHLTADHAPAAAPLHECPLCEVAPLPNRAAIELHLTNDHNVSATKAPVSFAHGVLLTLKCNEFVDLEGGGAFDGQWVTAMVARCAQWRKQLFPIIVILPRSQNERHKRRRLVWGHARSTWAQLRRALWNVYLNSIQTFNHVQYGYFLLNNDMRSFNEMGLLPWSECKLRCVDAGRGRYRLINTLRRRLPGPRRSARIAAAQVQAIN